MSLEISDSVGRWEKGARNLQGDVSIVQNMNVSGASQEFFPFALEIDHGSLLARYRVGRSRSQYLDHLSAKPRELKPHQFT